MTILDFEVSENDSFDYDTVQKVWGRDVDIYVLFTDEKHRELMDKEDIDLRGMVRQLSAKLKVVEENRDAVNAAVLSANIEGFSEDDLKTLVIDWILFLSYVDTGNCELCVYLGTEPDVLDGAEIAVFVHSNNTIAFDDLV